jgi:hypothetical protein
MADIEKTDGVMLSYERMDMDTKKSFEAFVLYRNLGAERSSPKVAEMLGKSVGWIERLCAKYRWVERAALWDAAIDKRAARQLLFDKEAATIEQLRLAKAMKKLGLNQIEKHQKLSDECDTPHIPATDAAKIAKEGAQLERLIHGDPNSIEEHRGGEYDWSQLGVEELQMFKAMLLRVKKGEGK